MLDIVGPEQSEAVLSTPLLCYKQSDAVVSMHFSGVL